MKSAATSCQLSDSEPGCFVPFKGISLFKVSFQEWMKEIKTKIIAQNVVLKCPV